MERISVELPGVAPDDPLSQQKNDMLAHKGLPLLFSVALDETRDQCELLFDAMLKAARVLTLNEIECYFLEVDDFGPVSFTNELRSLHFLLTALDCVKKAEDNSSSLDIMMELTLQKLEHLEGNETMRLGITCNGDKEKRLLDWAQREGIMSKLDVAVFDGFGRGGRAAADLAVNDVVLKIPQRLIICEDMVLDTDMHVVLKNFKEVSGETKVLLWSMRERHDPNSKFAPYFASLPDSFNTGLSFGVAALKALDDLDLSDAPYQLELIERWNLGVSHMIRGRHFSTSQLSSFGVPSRLLSTLCIAFMDEDEARSLSSGPQHIKASCESEVKGYEILLSILNGMIDPLGEHASNEEAEQGIWDAKLATTFKNQQRQLLHSACECCSLALKSLCP